MSTTAKRHEKLVFMTEISMLIAIEAIVCFTPLGSLPALGPIVATLSAIPVVIAALLMGTKSGAIVGFTFGLFSFIVWTFTPPSPLAFAFTPFYSLGEVQGNFFSLLICFVPRILIGVVTGILAKALCITRLPQKVSFAIAGAAGSLVNTLLVLGGIYVFFGEQFAAVNETSFDLVLGILGMTVLTSGIPEAAIAAVIGFATEPLKRIIEKKT